MERREEEKILSMGSILDILNSYAHLDTNRKHAVNMAKVPKSVLFFLTNMFLKRN